MTLKPLFIGFLKKSLRKHFQQNSVKATIGAKNTTRRELLITYVLIVDTTHLIVRLRRQLHKWGMDVNDALCIKDYDAV